MRRGRRSLGRGRASLMTMATPWGDRGPMSRSCRSIRWKIGPVVMAEAEAARHGPQMGSTSLPAGAAVWRSLRPGLPATASGWSGSTNAPTALDSNSSHRHERGSRASA